MWTYEGIMRDLLNEGNDCHHDSADRRLSFMVFPKGNMPYECYTQFYHNDETVAVLLFHNFPGRLLFALFEKDRTHYRRIKDICDKFNEKANGIVIFNAGFTDDNERFYIRAIAPQSYVDQPYKDQIYNYDLFKDVLIMLMSIHEAISNKEI